MKDAFRRFAVLRRSNAVGAAFLFILTTALSSAVARTSSPIHSASLHSREWNDDFQMTDIGKRVLEYPDRQDLSDPLNSFISFQFLKAEGKNSRFRSVNSYRIRGFFPPPEAPDSDIKKESREAILKTKIIRIIFYKSSVAGIITPYQGPLCIITYMSKENGEWLSAGEDMGNDLDDACAVFKRKASRFAGFIDRIAELKTVSTDASAMREYLQANGLPPKELVLKALSGHKVVIYGEIHRRKASWDVLKSLIADPRFVSRAGTIFMELSADKQPVLDDFFAAPHQDPTKLWEIFQSNQIDGWYDRGMYEFINALWILNSKLIPAEKIRVVAVDEPRPFHLFHNKDEMEAHFRAALDRNEQMAVSIFEAVKKNRDGRNHLFVVGVGHAYKSKTPGLAGGKAPDEAKPSAAAQLAALLSPGDVYSIFQHGPIISNDGTIHGKIRNGLLDAAFASLGDRPIAFELSNSPVGKEPFDGIYEIAYAPETGDFDANYDAYVFLGPLKTEPGEYLLYDILTDQFVVELRRRAQMAGASVERWFGIKEATKEAILNKLKNQSEKKRWPDLW